MNSINFWPILVSSIAAFALGALWYSPVLFGKEWMTLIKMTDADMKAAQARGVWKFYVAQFAITIVMFIVLSFVISFTQSLGAADGAFLAFILWLGFIVTVTLNRVIWSNVPFKLALIESVYNLITLAIGGAIIGAWR
jgi:hypothetical protein